MNKLRARLALTDSRGMTLVEVVVAISIMGIVATAAVAFIISSIVSSATHQRGQIAITIANQAMESASAQSSATNPLTGVSYLYQGRYKPSVLNVWTANAEVSGDATTYPGWDPTATAASVPSLPLETVYTRSGTDYKATTLIGNCYQAMSGGDCTVITGFDPAVQPVPAGMTQLIRVIVVVSWTAGKQCEVDGCSYQTTSLIDPHGDLQWNVHD